MAVILISSELPELLGMSHSIMVMRQGAIAGAIATPEATEEKIMRLATGLALAGSTRSEELT